MLMMTAHGRLCHQPELKLLPGGGVVCEFRLLTSRFAKGVEVTEAATFFCYGDLAEDFCATTVKGQEIFATGLQETQQYKPVGGEAKSFVKYRMSWFQRGRKPMGGRAAPGHQGRQEHCGTREAGNGQRPPPRPPQRDHEPMQQPQQRSQQRKTEHAPSDDGFLDEGGFTHNGRY